MNIYTIYKATNTINGKIYIGFDSNWPNRKSTHKNSAKYKKTIFQKAIMKYGWENFAWEILYQAKEEVDSIQESHTLNIMEPFFISEYNSYDTGYNMTKGGQGVSHNEDILKKKRETYILNLGVDNPQKCPIIKEKTKQTNLQNYGHEQIFQVPEFREKGKQTKKDKYNNENYNNRDKAKDTWEKIYGTDNPSKSKEIKDKKEKTSLENFGETHYMKSDKGKQIYQENMLEKYGVKSNLYIEKLCPFCNEIHPICHISQCKLNPNRNVYDRSGAKNPRAKRIMLNGVIFGSVKEAANSLNISDRILREYLKGRKSGYPKNVTELYYL